MSFHVRKILFKLALFAACYCRLFRGSLFRGHSVVMCTPVLSGAVNVMCAAGQVL